MRGLTRASGLSAAAYYYRAPLKGILLSAGQVRRAPPPTASRPRPIPIRSDWISTMLFGLSPTDAVTFVGDGHHRRGRRDRVCRAGPARREGRNGRIVRGVVDEVRSLPARERPTRPTAPTLTVREPGGAKQDCFCSSPSAKLTGRHWCLGQLLLRPLRRKPTNFYCVFRPM
jgi:hypothetical protein